MRQQSAQQLGSVKGGLRAIIGASLLACCCPSSYAEATTGVASANVLLNMIRQDQPTCCQFFALLLGQRTCPWPLTVPHPGRRGCLHFAMFIAAQEEQPEDLQASLDCGGTYSAMRFAPAAFEEQPWDRNSRSVEDVWNIVSSTAFMSHEYTEAWDLASQESVPGSPSDKN